MTKQKIIFYSSKSYEVKAFESDQLYKNFDITFYKQRLDSVSASAHPQDAWVCAFASDCLDQEVLTLLANRGVQNILLRSAGFNHVDIEQAKKLKMKIARVPAYSPESVAEHAVALMMTLSRKIHKAYNRVREGNFSLDGLNGFSFYQKSVGIIGMGKIGQACARIMVGMGCKVLAYDPYEKEALQDIGVRHVEIEEIFKTANIISLHCPLTKETHHIINRKTINEMKDGVMIINTGRGGLIDSKAIIEALKSKKVAHLGLDVYEEEEELFFSDHSEDIIEDDTFVRLMTFPNVIITGHQAFLTTEALANIAQTTLLNAKYWLDGRPSENEVY